MLFEKDILNFKEGDSVTGSNRANILLPSFVCFVEKHRDSDDCNKGFYYQILTRSQFTVNLDERDGVIWDGCLILEVEHKQYNLKTCKALLVEIIKS